MEISNLTLSIDEGKKKGETLERKPGASIRIGRILRGNTLAIKDPGISQKHLVVDFDSHISRWTATDLGASNGTTVNGLAIAPNSAFPLADGDTIKIGENTLMSVKISEPRSRRGRKAAFQGEVKRRMATRASAKLEERIESGGKGVVMKGRRNVKALSVVSSDTAVVMKEEERPSFEKIQVLVDDGSSKVLLKDDVLEPIKSDAKLLKRRIKKPSAFDAMKDEEGQSLEKMQVLVDDGSSKFSRKDDVLEPIKSDAKLLKRRIKKPSAFDAMKDEEGQSLEKMQVLVDDGSSKVSGKDDVLEPIKSDAKLLKRRIKKPSTFVAMKDEEGQSLEKIQVLVDDGSSKVSGKDDVLEPIKSDAKLLKRRIKKSSTFVAMKDEEGQSLEKIQVLVNDGRRRRRGKKDDVLEAVVVEGKIRVDEVEDGELANSRGKKKGRRGGRSKRISRKDEEVLESVAPDLNSVCLKGEEEKKMVVKNSASDDGKKLSGSRKVMFRIEDVEDDKDGMMMSGRSNKEEESTKSWSSFSEIRGIPNTTSKYREDKLINCHSTPFEARVERALNRGNAETSSSMET